MGKLKDDFRAEEDKWREYKRALREAGAERYRKEREARDAEEVKKVRERKAAKLDENPHLEQITLIEQTIVFCNSLIKDKGKEEKEEKKEVAYDNPKDTVVLKRD